jgi:CDP-diacylglycerol--serine O-phosphatidyltransferase
MTLVPPDGSRDPRVDDLTNVWLVHPAGRLMLPLALRWRVSANAVSITGLLLGIGAAIAYAGWQDWRRATLGLALCVAWLIADGLDGMIARATNTAGALGRFLDGVCDHSVFVLIYLVLAYSIGTADAWLLAVLAGAAHATQSAIYESERIRFHRRIKGEPGELRPALPRNVVARGYEAIAGSLDRLAEPFDHVLRETADPQRLGENYGRHAAPPLKLLALLSNNLRVIAIYLACLWGNPRLFWWFELVPLSLILAGGAYWHRRVERQLVREQNARKPR